MPLTTSLERRRAPLAVSVPAIAVTLVLLAPIAYLVIRAAGSADSLIPFLWRPRIGAVALRTFALVVSVTVSATILGTAIAWLLTRTNLPWRRAWVLLTAIPLVIPSFVYALVITTALSPRGLLQKMLEPALGITELPSIYGFPGAFISLTLLTYPYVLLPTRAALTNLDPAIEEASRTLGRGTLKTFASITLPALRPATAAGALLVALYTLSDFGAVSLLRWETFTYAIFNQYEAAFDRALAAALSLVLAITAIALVGIEGWTRGRGRYHSIGPGSPRIGLTHNLKHWRWPATGMLAIISFATTLGPMAVLSYWIVQGARAGESFGDLGEPLLNSLTTALLAAAALTAVAFPLAVFIVRYPGKLSAMIERTTYIGFALPGITVAIALVFLGVHILYPIYQTLLLLIIAYTVLFLPTTLGSIRSGILQLNPRIEEAARTLGKTRLQVLLKVTIPLVRGSMFAGAAMAFLLTMKELPATLVLGPMDFRTLATVTWAATSESFFASAAASSLMLIVVTAIPLALIISRGPHQSGPQATH